MMPAGRICLKSATDTKWAVDNMTIEKSFLICGSPHFSDYYTFSAGMQEIGITDGCAIFTFAMDGACHMAAIWAKQAHIPCSRIPLSDFIPSRQVQLLDTVSNVDEIVVFGNGEDDVTAYVLRLAKLARRTIYVFGKE